MAQPYVGEIRMFGGNFAPAGWMFCEGQLLPINVDTETLFQLIGTTYGGDGVSTFGVPDLRGRVPIHMGNGFTLGETGGTEAVTLTTNQIPAHSHSLMATTSASNDTNPANNLASQATAFSPYINVNPAVAMAPQAIAAAGGSQPHDNFQPYLCVDFIISLTGIFPSAV